MFEEFIFILLDLFFVTNILVSLLVLMVAMHTYRPLDFSSFPSLLLIATVLRLALNVASTRVVLAEGHTGSDAAGKIIEAFGKFIIASNYAVGIFVFVILVIINLVVITRGAGRVSEVSARFTLDAMPGKQMAIDADLNAGILEAKEATEKREEIAKEADGWDPSKVVAGSNTKMSWKCKTGHRWEAIVNSRTGGRNSGCPYCSNRKVFKGFNDLKKLFPEIAEEADGWDPSKVISGSHNYFWSSTPGLLTQN